MRSLLKAWGLALLLSSHAGGQPGGLAQSDASPSQSAIRAAVETLRHDPNLGHDETIGSLHWVDSKSESPAPTAAPNWLVGLFQFLSQAASLVLWVAGGICLAVAAIWVYRVVAAHRSSLRPAAQSAASHVQDLDIRPASLPADVGSAALALLAAGRTREALSLLYRGALSRAVHNFAVTIGESFTEGEALRAVTLRLDQTRARYFSALVGMWQQTVYAADIPPAESVAAMCKEFSSALGNTPI